MSLRIAIIDSEICNSVAIADDRNITNYYISDNKIVRKTIKGIFSSHGTDVLNNILYECKDIEIISIEVLSSDNKGKVIDLLRAIDFCIQKEISFINISLGIITQNSKLINALKKVCERAVEKGIIIISAMSNKEGKSYPAAFDFVTAVSSSTVNKEYINYNEKENEICFCSSNVFSKGHGKYIINTGNSYLSGYVTGVFCSLINKNIENKEKVLGFWGNSEKINKIFVNPFNENEFNKEVTLVYFEQNSFDTYLEKHINANVKKVNWLVIKEKKYFNTDTIIFGNLKLPCKKKIKKEIIQWLIYMNISQIYCLVPIFNTIERYQIVRKYNISIKTVYI